MGYCLGAAIKGRLLGIGLKGDSGSAPPRESSDGPELAGSDPFSPLRTKNTSFEVSAAENVGSAEKTAESRERTEELLSVLGIVDDGAVNDEVVCSERTEVELVCGNNNPANGSSGRLDMAFLVGVKVPFDPVLAPSS
mmetsp:Transcript_73141/g.147203  ORF Transcript_73141/g.147203 Transcript_73141/m.147203 type:complete len:138 (-) Transcript_73141:8-421(-)